MVKKSIEVFKDIIYNPQIYKKIHSQRKIGSVLDKSLVVRRLESVMGFIIII